VEIHPIRPYITAVIPDGANVGFIKTDEGVIVIDTTVSIKSMQGILDHVDIQAGEVYRVINTHLHADHINGNGLFDCPVICHSKAKTRMTKKCSRLGQSLITFEDEYRIDIGDIHLRLIHMGGHTPESMIVWLSDSKVLFSGDLIFSGRAPFLASITNINALIESLKWLPSLGAEVIVPGHGPLCDDLEVQVQLNYLETTLEVIRDHVSKGHSLPRILKDQTLPQMEGRNFERNIEWFYKRLK